MIAHRAQGKAKMSVAHLRGPIVSGALSWFRRTYGEEALEQALQRLPAGTQARFGAIPAVGWYPIAWFEELLDVLFAEAHARTGISREDFDYRGVEEAGRSIAASVYQLILTVVGPERFFPLLSSLLRRLYDQASLEVIENRHGYARIQLRGVREMKRPFLRLLPPMKGALARSGALRVVFTTSQEEESERNFLLEIVVRYE
jgi:hypothetical protein